MSDYSVNYKATRDIDGTHVLNTYYDLEFGLEGYNPAKNYVKSVTESKSGSEETWFLRETETFNILASTTKPLLPFFKEFLSSVSRGESFTFTADTVDYTCVIVDTNYAPQRVGLVDIDFIIPINFKVEI